MSNIPLQARTWGCRFSRRDAVALALFGMVAAWLRHRENPLGGLVVIAVAHFFLFCNVVRMARTRELIWAGTYILNVGCCLWLGQINCARILAVQLLVTVALVLIEVRAPTYHGIFAKRLNPRLAVFLQGGQP